MTTLTLIDAYGRPKLATIVAADGTYVKPTAICRGQNAVFYVNVVNDKLVISDWIWLDDDRLANWLSKHGISVDVVNSKTVDVNNAIPPDISYAALMDYVA